MADASLETRNIIVESARLSADFYGAYLVGHTLPSPSIPNGFDRVMYAREGIAVGRGLFGQIYPEHAQNECPEAPRVRAVKEIKKDFVLQHKLDWKREVEALILLNRSEGKDYFVSFYGWYETNETLFLAMEYFPLGDLSRFVNDVTTEEDVKSIAFQVVAGLEVMHSYQIVHRDLNPRNILIAATKPRWKLKLADFGSSKKLHETTGLHTKTGTVGYMAPEYNEFVRNDSEYAPPTPAVDLWSAGCIFYELYTKDRPFNEQNGIRQLEKYCLNPVLPEALQKSFASFIAQDALRSFLEPNPALRINAKDATLMLWLAEEQDPATSDLVESIEEAVALFKMDSAASEDSPKQHSMPSLGSLPNGSAVSVATTATLVNPNDGFPRSSEPALIKKVPFNPISTSEVSSPFLSPHMSGSGGFSAEQPKLPPRRQSEVSSHSSTSYADPSEGVDQMPILSKSVTAPNPPLPPRRQSSANSTQSMPNIGSLHNLPSDSLPPSLPPRRRSSAQQNTANSAMLRTQVVVEESFQSPDTNPDVPFSEWNRSHPLSSEQEQTPLDTMEASKEMPEAEEQDVPAYEPIEPWFACSYMSQELRMSIGSLSSQRDPPSFCDQCYERARMIGPTANGSLHTILYLCETCGKGRLLCERCARETINRASDPHEADHMLRRVGPSLSFSFAQFLQSHNVWPEMRENMPSTYGSAWLRSDHGFEAPFKAGAKSLRAHISLEAPSGIHNVAVHIRIAFDSAKISSDVLGTAQKKRMKLSKEPFGELAVGVETSSLDVDDREKLYERYMPANSVRQPVVYTSGQTDYDMIFRVKTPLPVQNGQRLIICIRSSHDPNIFKTGCPFKWYLNFVGLSQFGDRTQLATKGQQTRRDQAIASQKKIERDQKIDRNIGYVSKAMQIGTMAYGLGGAAVGYSSRRAKKRDYEWSAMNHYVNARNGLMGVGGAGGSVYGHEGYGQQYGVADTASLAGGGVSDVTQQWVADQAVEPFVASFEAVEYSVGQDGSATASYVHYGAS